MNTININGQSYTGGNSISMINGKVFIDGKEVTPEGKEIYIQIQGNIENLKVDCCDELSIKGDVGALSSISGDIHVSGNVTGSISSISGDVFTGDVAGSVSTVSGSIN